ncbi:hypothetical protein PEXP_087450 [Penicillium expansum]|nr:hypothetical protein PEXP_087450 [Penicillium expansum]
MPSHGTMTAAQRALGIAEIIGLIISFVPSGWFASSNALIHCGLVNKLWLGEVLPVIWSHIGTQIERVFTKLKPGRRQFYANFVVFAESCILNDGLCSKDLSQNLKDIVFPKMETILMFTCGERGECSLPRMNCPNLYRMTFQDMDYENEEKEDDMCPDAWESIFWDISTKYPSLKELNFDHPPRVFPHAIRRFKKRHPNLQGCLKKLKAQEITQFFGHGFSFPGGVAVGNNDYFEN